MLRFWQNPSDAWNSSPYKELISADTDTLSFFPWNILLYLYSLNCKNVSPSSKVAKERSRHYLIATFIIPVIILLISFLSVIALIIITINMVNLHNQYSDYYLQELSVSRSILAYMHHKHKFNMINYHVPIKSPIHCDWL